VVVHIECKIKYLARLLKSFSGNWTVSLNWFNGLSHRLKMKELMPVIIHWILKSKYLMISQKIKPSYIKLFKNVKKLFEVHWIFSHSFSLLFFIFNMLVALWAFWRNVVSSATGYDVILQEKEKGRSNVLRLAHPGCETHFLSTDSASEIQSWINKIEPLCSTASSDAANSQSNDRVSLVFPPSPKWQ